MEPGQADRIAGGQVRFREAIHLGHTHLSLEEVKELAVSLGRDYNGCDYSVLHRSEVILMMCHTTVYEDNLHI